MCTNCFDREKKSVVVVAAVAALCIGDKVVSKESSVSLIISNIRY